MKQTDEETGATRNPKVHIYHHHHPGLVRDVVVSTGDRHDDLFCARRCAEAVQRLSTVHVTSPLPILCRPTMLARNARQ